MVSEKVNIKKGIDCFQKQDVLAREKGAFLEL
jgi:hypothetical protein